MPPLLPTPAPQLPGMMLGSVPPAPFPYPMAADGAYLGAMSALPATSASGAAYPAPPQPPGLNFGVDAQMALLVQRQDALERQVHELQAQVRQQAQVLASAGLLGTGLNF